jgi:cellulose synthase/poly-beta-1,6-N-acetylglucosamine synthase-like glycosyltransferase
MFQNTLLNAQPARYAVVAESVLPIVLLGASFFVTKLGPKAGATVRGRPPPIAFGMIWSLLSILMFFSLLIASMNFDSTSLILFAVFSLFVMIGCVMWVWKYTRGHKQDASYFLMFTSLSSFLAVISSLGSTLNSDAKITVSLLSTPLPVWTIIAIILGLLEMNME